MKAHSEKLSEISQSDDSLDWNALRLQSLAPGGFGNARAHIWHASAPLHHLPLFPQLLNFTFRPSLLHVDVNAIHPIENEKEHDLHRDERQIRLDTDRSFVLYPVGDAPSALTFSHFRSLVPVIGRRQSRRWSTCTSRRAQQTHCSTFQTSSRFELLSGAPLNLRSIRSLTPEYRVSMISPLSFNLLYHRKLLCIHWRSSACIVCATRWGTPSNLLQVSCCMVTRSYCGPSHVLIVVNSILQRLLQLADPPFAALLEE